MTATTPGSAAGPTLAGRAARIWVRLYTTRLPDETRNRRRAEIESDLWEHVADARSHRQRNSSTQLDLLARVLVGIPADVAWHAQARRYAKDERSMQNLPASTERAASPVVAAVTVAAFAVIGLMAFGVAAAFSYLVLIPLGIVVFGGTRSVLARRPSASGVAAVVPPADDEEAYLHTRRRLRIVLAISGGIFVLTVVTWVVLITMMESIGDATLMVVNLPGMLSFFAAVGSVLLLGANTLGLQRLRIDTASTREDYRRLRHRVVVALGATAVVFGLMVGAWIAMIATMESLNGGLAVLVNVVATGSLLRGGRIVWLLAVTRRPGGRQRVAAT